MSADVMALVLLVLLQDPDRLIRDLADEDPGVRDRAMETLIEMGAEKAAPLLERAAADRDPEVRARARAVRGVFNPPPPELDPQKVLVFSDSSVICREILLDLVMRDALRGVPAHAPEVPAPAEEDVRAWVRDLSAASLEARDAATEKLRASGKHVEAVLTEAATSADREPAFRAQSLLTSLETVLTQTAIIDALHWNEPIHGAQVIPDPEDDPLPPGR